MATQRKQRGAPARASRADRSGRAERGCRVAGRVWLERGEETFLAWGRVVLLERIAEHGSISAAARSMGMGYRHAWELVEDMNRLAPAPLVEKTTGGRRGGGARLTPEGQAAVAGFWRLVTRFGRWLSRQKLAGRGGRSCRP